MIKEFDGDLKVFEEPCIVDVWANWCGPCKAFGKSLEDFSKNYPDITIYKVDAEKYPEVAERLDVMSLPTIFYMEKGEIIWRHTGLMTATRLKEELGL